MSEKKSGNSRNVSSISLERMIRSIQIIRASLIAGVVTFLAITLVLVGGVPKKLEFGTFEIILTLIVIQSFVLYLFAPKIVRIGPDRQNEIRKMAAGERDQAVMTLWMPVEIIRGAAIEGATFFALILALTADSKVGLIVGALLIAAAIAVFPTASRVRSRVEDLRSHLGL